MSWPVTMVGAVLLLSVGFVLGRRSHHSTEGEEKIALLRSPATPDPANSSTAPVGGKAPAHSSEKDETSRIAQLRADLHKNATEPVERLNELQALLTAALKNHTLTSMGLVAMFKEETDPMVLDVLQGVLAANPDFANLPGVTEAFTALALTDPNPSRRQTAIAYLGTVWDKDGKVKDALLGIVQGGEDIGLRMCALGTLKAYVVKNWTESETVSARLLSLAQTDKNPDVRAEAVNALEIRTSGEKGTAPLLGFLKDSEAVVRLAAAEKLGDAPPTARPAVVKALEQTIAQEPEGHVKQIMLANLVRAGRSDSVAALERMVNSNTALKPDAQDYLSILRGGYVDWTDISRMKGEMEESRGR